jgi:DNA polymerase III sliding clamp (beta) subunit (PCNA family)
MQWNIPYKDFLSALTQVSAVIKDNAHLPILSTVELEFTPQRLILRGTTMGTVWVTAFAPCRGDSDQAFNTVCLPAQFLYTLLRESGGSEIVFCTVDDNYITVYIQDVYTHGGSITNTLNTYDPRLYPAAVQFAGAVPICSVNSDTLDTWLSMLIPAVSTDANRTVLHSVLIRQNNDQALRGYAVDGFRLFTAALPDAEPLADHNTYWLLPLEAAKAIANILPHWGQAPVLVSTQARENNTPYLIFTSDVGTIVAVCAPGVPQDYQKQLDEWHKIEPTLLTVNQEGLMKALRAVDKLSKSEGFMTKHNVHLTLSNGELLLYTEQEGVGRIAVTLPCGYQGTPEPMAVNLTFLLAAAAPLKEGPVVMELRTIMAPISVYQQDTPAAYRAEIMPLKD